VLPVHLDWKNHLKPGTLSPFVGCHRVHREDSKIIEKIVIIFWFKNISLHRESRMRCIHLKQNRIDKELNKN